MVQKQAYGIYKENKLVIHNENFIGDDGQE
jgi:hypothetical protein